MPVSSRILRRLFFSLSISIIFILLGCDSKPTDSEVVNPPPPPPPVTDHYALYALSNSGVGAVVTMHDVPADTLRRWDVVSATFSHLALTPDKKTLLVSGSGLDSTVVYNADSLERIDALPYGGIYHFDRGRLTGVLVGMQSVYKINVNTLAQGDSLPYSFRYTQIDTLNGLLYGAGEIGIDPTYVYRVNYLTMTLVDSLPIVDQNNIPITVTDLLPINGQPRLYFFGTIGSASAAYILNLADTNVVASVAHDYPVGGFLKSVDNLTVFKADPGPLTTPGSGKVWKYAIATDAISGSISTVIMESGMPFTVNITSLAMTPDGKYLYAAGGVPGRVLQIPISAGSVAHAFDPYDSFFPPEIVIGKKL